VETFACEIVVVGGGVVGLAVAERLASVGREVTLVERHGRFGLEASSRNSEVIHAGIYYPAGSLKARLAIEGRGLMYAWCERRGVPHARIGKLIVATEEGSLSRLEAIANGARACGDVPLSLIDGAALRRLEPNVRGVAALYSPATGIVDSHALMASLASDLVTSGGTIAYATRAERIEAGARGPRVVARGPEGIVAVDTRAVVLAAGLEGDRLLRASGVGPEIVPDHVPVKGEYFSVRKRGLVSRLLYPVPPPALQGLGVHVTLDLSGAARLGPNTVTVSRDAIDPDGGPCAAFDVDPDHAGAFFEAASRYLDGLSLEDLRPGYAGIRPKLAPDRFVDFVVRDLACAGLPGVIALAGIESPGLTASLALARHVEALCAPYVD